MIVRQDAGGGPEQSGWYCAPAHEMRVVPKRFEELKAKVPAGGQAK